MHWRGHSDRMQSPRVYDDVVADVSASSRERVDALARGRHRRGPARARPRAWASPRPPTTTGRSGRARPALHELGLPVLLGASRKTFLGRLGRAQGAEPRPAAERDIETTATSVMAAMAGLWCVRVHDVASTVRALTVVQAALEHAPEDLDDDADEPEGRNR